MIHITTRTTVEAPMLRNQQESTPVHTRPSAPRHRADERRPTESVDTPHSRELIRQWLRQCEFLDRTNSVSPHALWVIGFAVRWAPFGGAGAAELLETFGVTPARFRQLLSESLDPRGTADGHIRALMQDLREALLAAWTRRA